MKENFVHDAISGFLVFLLALPLSLGIAKASGFPSAMGVLTAIIGGLAVSLMMGSRLTIKGPAAGLITVCIAAVTDLDALHLPGATGVQLACGAIVVMAVLQFTLGLLKFGSFSDFFPRSVVHGMLAAIGILIVAKQFPILLGVDPELTKGLSPIQLFVHVPSFIVHATPSIALIGIISLVIIFGLPNVGGIFRRIPSPMVVLVVMIPLGIALHIENVHPGSMVAIGDFWKNVGLQASFAAAGTAVFWKYVVMFLFVNSLESLLTVKAIDSIDPWRRKSDYDKDLRALAVGNGLSGLLGGLPMISEVARSSANVNSGARTRWANFFHGLFLLVSMLVLIPIIEMIPSAALAAMLISVAYRLASPKEFIGTYKIGPEQMVIFLSTIAFTVAGDLLMGVAAGVVVEVVFHLVNGATLKSLFKADYSMAANKTGYLIYVRGVATFSNFVAHKKLWNSLEPGKDVTFDFSEARLVDHSFMDQLHLFEEERQQTGSHVSITGLESFNPLSTHPMAARKIAGSSNRKEMQLSQRQVALRDFSEKRQLVYYPQTQRNAGKYRDFPIQRGNKILYEENIILFYPGAARIEVSDITLSEGARHAQHDTHITGLHVSDLDVKIPDFALEPEGLWSRVSDLVTGKDIDFTEYPQFSSTYYLTGDDEEAIRAFFTEKIIRFFEDGEQMHVECHKNKLLIYKKRDLLTTDEIEMAIKFAEDFVRLIHEGQKTAQAVFRG